MAAGDLGDDAGARATADAPYRQSGLPVETRVEDLLARMTTAEKLAQLGAVWSTALVGADGFDHDLAGRHLANGTGHVTRIGASTGLRPGENAAFMNEIQRFLVDHTRLGIPAVVHEESVAGLCARDATQFPCGIGLASTWDPELVERVAGTVREQMLAVGARWTLSPVVDIARDPRWGRVEETYGEDPYLTGRIAVGYVRGLQTDDLSRGVVCTAKHFLGYGLSEGGLNHAPSHIGARELRDVVAEPFRAVIQDAGLASVMNAYNAVDGLPCGGSGEILTDLLRDELGFAGVVVADYFTTMLLIGHHAVAEDKAAAGRMALEAGLDVELPALDCYAALDRELADGSLDMAVVDRAVSRVLRSKFALGLFESPYVDAAIAQMAFDTPGDREVAREAARRSIVLLRNHGDLLPLDPATISRLVVIGPAADDPRLLIGDYGYPSHAEISFGASPGGGTSGSGILPSGGRGSGSFSAGPYYVPMVTPLAGLRDALGDAVELRHETGCSISGDDADGIEAAVAVASAADVAIVCLGGKSGLLPDCTSGEFRDASRLDLTGLQQDLIEAVVATGTPTVVVLVGGRVFALPWVAEHVPAIVQAWQPGEEGGAALADVLLGEPGPSGRLPITVPRSVGHVPSHHGHLSGGGRSQMLGDYSDAPVSPLYPFGHGLAYTTFSYDGLEITPGETATDGEFTVEATVSNTGDRPGTEVVQLYLRDAVASVVRPVRQLAGFARVPLGVAETATVRFEVDASILSFHDASLRRIVEPGRIDVMVGASSADTRLRGSVGLTGDVRVITDPSEITATSVAVTPAL